MKLMIKYVNGNEITYPIIDFWSYKNIDDELYLGYYLGGGDIVSGSRHIILLDPDEIEEISIKEFDR